MIESAAYDIIKEDGRIEGRQEGLQEGQRRGLITGITVTLEVRFGVQGLRLLPEIEQLQDVELLQSVLDYLKVASSPEDVRSVYRQN